MVRLNGVRYVFNPDHVDGKTGLPGYDQLPKGLSKEQRDSFRTIKAEAQVEAATAAPGELRAAARKSKASDDGPETVDEDDGDE